MITEIGAVKVRGGEVLGEFQTLVNPYTEIPAFIAVLTGITNTMVADAPPIESALPAFLEFAAGSCPGRAQRALRRRVPQALRASAGPAVAALRGARHGQAGAAGDHPRRRAQLQALLAGPGFQLRHHPQPPGPRRRPGHGRRAARPDGAPRRARSAHAEELQTFSSRVSPPSARSATSPRRFRTPRASTSSATTAPASSTSAPRATCAPASVPTSPPPRPGPGWARWWAWPRRSTGIECATPLEAEVRELRLIAEHKPRYNRRSRFPEKVHFIKLTREPWPRLSLVRRVLDDDADYLGPFSSQEDRREVPGRAARHLPGPPVLRPARARAVPLAVRARRDGALPLAVRRQRRPRRRTPRSCGALRDTLLRDPDDVVDDHQPADGRARRRRAVRGGRRPSRPAGRLRPRRRPHPAAERPDQVSPRSSPPAARTTGAGRSTSSATAGSPPPA